MYNYNKIVFHSITNTQQEQQPYKIFNKVEGQNGKLNDVIIFNSQDKAKYNVIFFGGDTQVFLYA
jgi:hypothetical protein